jgi:lipopolysaccharide biosynthesis regulator YciM
MFQMAIQLADSLPVGEQVRLWSEIGRWLVKSGDQAAVRTLVQRMVETAQSIADERIKQQTLSTASGFSTKVGDLDVALDIAATIKDGSEKALALRWLAERMATTTNSPDAAVLFRKLSDIARDLSQSKLPTERSTANRMLANIAGIQAVTRDVPSAIQTLKRITNQDYHQESGAYPEIITLLAQQGNFTGARQVADNVERKRWQESPMASALKSLGRAYAEAGEARVAVDWARQMTMEFVKTSILLGVAEGLMNRQGIENIIEERPELTLEGRCEVDQWRPS